MSQPKLYIVEQDCEADTCQKEVTPRLKSAGVPTPPTFWRSAKNWRGCRPITLMPKLCWPR